MTEGKMNRAHRPDFAVGMIDDWKGQEFRLIDIRPHRRRDGSAAIVLVWQSRCLECGDPFEFIKPQLKLTYPTRRCPACVKGRPLPSLEGFTLLATNGEF